MVFTNYLCACLGYSRGIHNVISFLIINFCHTKTTRIIRMKGICSEAEANYQLYERLLIGAKMTEGEGIVISELKITNAKWLVHKLPVKQLTVAGYRSELHTEVGLKQDGNFKFILFARRFTSTPLANFDSKGISHRNNQENVPLAEQQVTTPHFNRYDEQGRRVAYKTEALRNPESANQLENISNCVFHFYDEFNIQHQPAGYPTVEVRTNSQREFFPVSISDDPLAYVPRF